MTPNKSNRGRPKGTGLNDAAQLRAIAGLIASDPDLKPTTAIKRIGITDPSVIRRLRDKFSALESELIAEVAPQLPFGDQPAAPAAAGAPAASQAIPGLPAGSLAAGSLAAGCLAAESLAAGCLAAGSLAAGSLAAEITAAETLRPGARVVPLASVRPERKTEPVAAAELKPNHTATIQTLPRPRRPQLVPLPSETELPNWMGMGLSLFVLGFEAQYAVLGTLFQWPPLSTVVKSHVAFTELAVALAASSPTRCDFA